MPPFNVSDWNPSPSFLSSTIGELSIPILHNRVEYIFSYTVDSRDSVLTKLGFDTHLARKGCLLVPSGSVAILMAIHMIKAMGFKSIYALCPVYFTVLNNCLREEIHIDKIYANMSDAGIFLPEKMLDLPEKTPLWLTNPFYCTSVNFSERDLTIIDQAVESGRLIVCDECLNLWGNELARRYNSYDNFIGLYSPHKSICINGAKFAIIVFSAYLQQFFDAWSDVFCGCLSISNLAAIHHFLSPNYERYMEVFLNRIYRPRRFVDELIDLFGNVRTDHNNKGYLISLYFPNIPAALGKDINFLWQVVHKSGGLFIPGIRNHFSENAGLSFRLNLALDSPEFRATVIRLVALLNDYNSGSLS